MAVEIDVTLEPLGLAVRAAVPYLIARQSGETHAFRISAHGALERLTREPLPYFCRLAAAAEGQLLVIESQSSSAQGITPSALYALDIEGGAVKRVATATVGSFSHLRLDGGRAVWLEAVDGGAAFFKVGHREDVSAICWAPLPL